MVGSSPTLLCSAYFGALDLDKAAIICFPQGLPGFETERQFAAVQIPGQQPLLYLQSIATSNLCLLTLPVQAICPDFHLELSTEDRDAIKLGGAPEQSRLLSLAILAAEPGTGATANVAAPLVINLDTQLAIQSLQSDERLSYCHPIPSSPPVC